MTITRKDWSQDKLTCMACGRTSSSGAGYDEEIGPWAMETHEIARGIHKQRGMKEPAAWLRLCEGLGKGCHTNMSGVPIVVQLALKKRADPEHYDRSAVLRCRLSPDTEVTEAEVDAMVELLDSGVAFDDRHLREGN